MSSTVVNPGLEGIVVGETILSNVEGEVGRLTYRGYDIHDLAEHATFEEVAHLLLFGDLPSAEQLGEFTRALVAGRAVPSDLIAMLRDIPTDAWPMDVLRTGVSALAHFVPHRPDGSHETSITSAIDLIAKFPTLVAAWDRLRRGLEPIGPDPNLTHAANFLWMKDGVVPFPEAEKALDIYLILLADHSYNASTFSARVTASTGADLYGSIAAAVATLAGDLHGGAPSKVMTMLEEIADPANSEAYVRRLLGRGEKIMGMGHREYKIRDPRAQQLERMAKQLTEKSDTPWYRIARALEDASNSVLQELKPGKRIYANVEFYTAPTLSSLGIPSDEFTCTFACGRIAGWAAHVLEQNAHNRLIRPQATYVGPAVHAYRPIGERHTANGSAANGSRANN
jgi:citrate synthase